MRRNLNERVPATCWMGLDMRRSLCMDLRTLSRYPRSRFCETRGHVNVTILLYNSCRHVTFFFPCRVFSLLVLTDALITRSRCRGCVWAWWPRPLTRRMGRTLPYWEGGFCTPGCWGWVHYFKKLMLISELWRRGTLHGSSIFFSFCRGVDGGRVCSASA